MSNNGRIKSGENELQWLVGNGYVMLRVHNYKARVNYSFLGTNGSNNGLFEAMACTRCPLEFPLRPRACGLPGRISARRLCGLASLSLNCIMEVFWLIATHCSS